MAIRSSYTRADFLFITKILNIQQRVQFTAAPSYALKTTTAITNANDRGDDYTLKVKDQYDQDMSEAEFYVNGKKEEWVGQPLDKGKEYVFKMIAGTVTKEITVVPGMNSTATVEQKKSYDKNITVASGATLVQNAGQENTKGTTTITLAKDINTLGAPLVIENGVKVVVDGVNLDATGQTITVKAGGKLEIASGGLLITKQAVDVKGDGDGVADTDRSDGYLTVNGTWEHTAAAVGDTVTVNGVLNGSGHATIDGANATTGAVAGTGLVNVTGSTLVLKAVKFAGAVNLAGHVELQGAIDFDNKQVVLGDELVITLDTSAGITNASALVMKNESEVTVELANGVEYNYVATADTTATLAPTGLTSGDIVPGDVQRTMDAIKQTDTHTGGYSIKSSYGEDLKLGSPTYTWDADAGIGTYEYKVTGTLKYSDSVAGYGDGYHYAYAVEFDSETVSGAKIRYGSNLKAGTYTVSSGWMAETNSSETTFCLAWATEDPSKIQTKDFVVEYTFADGSRVLHHIDLSAVTFAPKAAEKPAG